MANDNNIREMRQLFNSPFVSLENSFENLKPLLGLLRTGYYALIDVELYPSDGNGKFFWKVNNTPVYNKASSTIYGGDGLWSEVMTKYILPSQPPTRFNRETAEYYRKNDNYRAIAYYLEGYLCTLIDGHHKAVAAALEHPRFKELAFHFCSYGGFVGIWQEIFLLLAKIKNEDVENFFIQYLIDAEIERTDLNKIIDDYLREM